VTTLGKGSRQVTLDGFLTVLALLAALYAVLTPVQRVRLTLSWRLQLLVAIPACTAILAFELLDVLPPSCPAALGDRCRFLELGAADPGVSRKVAFLIAFAWLIASVAIHRYSRPSLGSLRQLTQLATALLDEEQFDDLIKLVEPNLELITRASRRKYWSQRLHDRLEEFGPIDPHSFAAFGRGPGPQPYRGENLPEWVARPIRRLASLVPAHERAQEAATDLLQLVLHSNKLLEHIVHRRPHFGVALARLDAFGVPDFLERYLSKLIATPGSALYQELAGNDISEGQIGYKMPERNRLLYFLFAQPKNAENLSAWKPVGDYIERLLDGEERPEYWKHLNGDSGWFERERTSDPVWAAMFFFDVMVTSAARHDIEYHMWLYYLPHFADRLEKGYDSSGDEIDREAEFPTRAARLLYELVTFITSWVGIYDRLPVSSPLRKMPERHDHASTIPHSAALALGTTVAKIIRSDRIDDGVIQTLHDVALRSVRELHDDAETGPMRRFVIEALLRGGHGPAPAGHILQLRERFGRLDYFEKHELADYEKALAERIASDPGSGRSRRATL
jgi:hypothetical protein